MRTLSILKAFIFDRIYKIRRGLLEKQLRSMLLTVADCY